MPSMTTASGQGQALRKIGANVGAGTGTGGFTPTGGGGGGGGKSGGGGSSASSGGGPKPAPKKSGSGSPTPTQPIVTNTPVNPMQQSAYDAWNKYNAGLAEGNNTEITHQLQQNRDELSVGLGKEVNNSLLRGADPGLFATRYAESGRRSLNDLQAKLTDVALGRRAEALGGVTGSANLAASGQRELHLGTMANSLAQRRLDLDAADAKQRTIDSQYSRLLSMLGSIGSGLGGYGGGGGVLGINSSYNGSSFAGA